MAYCEKEELPTCPSEPTHEILDSDMGEHLIISSTNHPENGPSETDEIVGDSRNTTDQYVSPTTTEEMPAPDDTRNTSEESGNFLGEEVLNQNHEIFLPPFCRKWKKDIASDDAGAAQCVSEDEGAEQNMSERTGAIQKIPKPARKNKKRCEATRKEQAQTMHGSHSNTENIQANDGPVSRSHPLVAIVKLSGDPEKDKEIRKLMKKLDDIHKIKLLQREGTLLENNQLLKLAMESKFITEIDDLMW